MNGHPAELINGGQFPVVVPAGLGTVAIEWRDFGVILRAVPIILGGGRVRLEVEPEVSERDFSSGVVVEGTTVPGLSVRRTRTQVEMNFGETLIIAGLISWRKVGETQKLPFFGDLPWIGAAFGIKNFNSTETELVVMLTPEYVAPLRPDQVPNGGPGAFTDDPTSHELYFHNLLEVPKWGDDCLGCQHGVFPGTMMPMGNCNCCDRDSASQPGLIAPNRQQPATVHSGQPRNPYQIQEPRSTAPPSTPGTPGAPEAHYAIPQPLPPARPPAPEPNGPPGLIAPGGP